MKIAIINGPNLNLLGKRKPEVYGNDSLKSITDAASKRARQLKLEVWAVQSNSEGELVDAVQRAARECGGIIINAAAYSHSSIALRDALEAAQLPVIEVHLSNIYQREAFRRHSYVSEVARGVVCGLGGHGYVLAVEGMAQLLGSNAE